MAIVRTIAGVFAGLFVMFCVIMGIEYVGHQAYPPPPGLDPMNPQHLSTIMASQPFLAKAIVVLAWVLGAFAGGWVAARISRNWPRTAAVLIALVVMSGVVGMILQLPDHPKWMGALGLLLPIPATLLAARWARPRAVPDL